MSAAPHVSGPGSEPREPTGGRLAPLAWDSQHFGRSVCRIEGRVESDADLAGLLTRARREGCWLVYFLAERRYEIGAMLLRRFAGIRVVGHVQYLRELDALSRTEERNGPTQLLIEAFEGAADDPQLELVGMLAGEYSRFTLDRRLERERCEALYRLWVRKSASGELADQVLVARCGPRISGMLSFSVHGSEARIGLVGVHPDFRGRGVGRALVASSEREMVARGARRSLVATQSENTSACRLYERAGYRPHVRGVHYHFMPSA